MSSGRPSAGGTPGPPGGGNLWRDIAAVVVQQVADRVRESQDAARSSMDPSLPRPPAAKPAVTRPLAPPPLSTGTLGRDLKDLVVSGIRATSDTINEYQTEKERRRIEAPMRRAQSRAATAKAGALGMGAVAVVMLAGGAGGIVMEDPALAVPPIVMSVGAGAGAVVLNRRGKELQAEADAQARRLGAASASAISIHGASAYTLPLPSQSSMAYEPTRRLVAQKAALAELLPDVEGIAPELRPLAEESEKTLSAYAERIVKLERAQAAAAGSTALDAPLARAVAQYEEGVGAHQKLVEAAATVMAELVTPHVPDPAHDSITEAADRLQGLAEGLRQVRHDIPVEPALPIDRPDPAGSTAAPKPGAPRPARRRDRRRDLAD